MFTGIVQGVCTIESCSLVDDVVEIDIQLGNFAHGLAIGGSVAVNGCCLTAVNVEDSLVRFELVHETASLTNLGLLQEGARVNVERSLRFGDEIGGHMLSGHIDSTVCVLSVESRRRENRVAFEVPPDLTQYIFAKGFVALDGASLTVAAWDPTKRIAEVNFIPETLRQTTFSSLAVGSRINIEVDCVTKAIVNTTRVFLQSREIDRNLS